MELLTLVAGWMICIFLAGLGAAIIWRIFTGKIDLSMLISEPNGDASLSRLQFLVFTFVIAISLFLIIVSQTPHPAFPQQIPPTVLSLLGISASSYLVSKGIQFSNPAGVEARIPQILISPESPTVRYANTCQFVATVTQITNPDIKWSIVAGLGTLDATGLLTAPAAAPAGNAGPQHTTIKAEIVGKPDLFDLAVVTYA